MKKIIGLLMLLVAFTACEGPMGSEGPMGPEGPAGSGDGVVEGWKNITFTVKSEDWQLINNMDGDPYYMYEFQWDELTDYVYEEGIVLGYLFTQVGGIETMTPLPYVLHRQDAKGNQWTETYTYDVSPGYVAFYATYNDFKVQEKPATMDFRVSILW